METVSKTGSLPAKKGGLTALYIGMVSYFCADNLRLPPYIGMASDILLSTHLMFIRAPVVMYWVIVEPEVNQNS